jgi:hypothetical protein
MKSGLPDNGRILTAVGWQNYLREEKEWPRWQAREYVRNAIQRGSLITVEKRYTTQ